MATTTLRRITAPEGDSDDRRADTVSATTTAVVAALVNLVVYTVGRAADVEFGLRFSDADPWSTVPAAQIVVSTVVGVGAARMASLRFPRRLGWIRAAGAVVVIASLTPLLAVTGSDPATRPLLTLMHLITGGAFLYATRRS